MLFKKLQLTLPQSTFAYFLLQYFVPSLDVKNGCRTISIKHSPGDPNKTFQSTLLLRGIPVKF